jgi:hypothetical protein
MPNKIFLVNLNDNERQSLDEMTRKETLRARQFKRAMSLLKADESMTDPQIEAVIDVPRPIVKLICKRFV